MQSIQNLGLALISMLAGLIVDLKGYLVLEMFYMVWLCGKCLMVFEWFIRDDNMMVCEEFSYIMERLA